MGQGFGLFYVSFLLHLLLLNLYTNACKDLEKIKNLEKWNV